MVDEPLRSWLRERILRALGLSRVWMELQALSARLKRVEQDVVALQRAPRSQTIPASPPPPVAFDPARRRGET